MSYPPPHGYTELTRHHEPYTFIQTPSLPSQGHRTIRLTYSPAASQPSASQPSTSHPRGSHPYISQPHGSHPSISQPLRSQPLVSQPLGSHPAMSLSQGSQPSLSSTPSISGLCLRGSSSDPPTQSTHASNTHASDDDDEVQAR
uniref:Proline-rich protein 27-like n=1 Tax=Nicotiana tabacum TaxID=4097 RepID=A0A1S3ZJ65_TOBAC|nr:PREDICTED: proline-rich protein 27-like [Nicotiana tabacum]